MSISVKETLSKYSLELKETSDTPALDISILLEFVTGITKVKQIADPDALLSEDQESQIQKLVARRKQHEPIAYITQSKGFWRYDFYVDPRVLIPRPETEILVEQGIIFARNLLQQNDIGAISVLDLGAGSGCVGLSIVKDLKDVYPNKNIQLTLVDASKDALEVSRINAKKLHVNARFLQSNWLTDISETFDLIVSNPPYIAHDDIRVYPGGEFEPKGALYADDGGHADIKIILNESMKHLKTPGMLLVEIGQGSADTFKGVVDDVLIDANGIERVLVRCKV